MKKAGLVGSDCLFPVVLFVPIVGILMVLTQMYMRRFQLQGGRELDVDKLRVDDVRYTRIELPRSDNLEITVPLEEAMLINDRDVRRGLIMDILRESPEAYTTVLEKASLSDDTELSHYATTAMMTIQTDYENSIHVLEDELRVRPGDQKLLEKYTRMLHRYIDSGLITGRVLMIYREKQNTALTRLWNLNPDMRSTRYELLENRIAMAWANCLPPLQAERLEGEMERTMQRWPEDERSYMVAMDYASTFAKANMAQKILETIEEKQVYLSKKGQDWYDFWKES